MNHFLWGMMLLACLHSASLRAQDERPIALTNSDGLKSTAASLPASYFNQLDKTAQRQSDALQKKSAQYLAKLSRQEEKICRKLARTDSAKACRLFADARLHYQQYLQQVKGGTLPQPSLSLTHYLPVLDSAKTGLSFLSSTEGRYSQQPLVGAIKGAGEKLVALQSRFNQSADIQDFVARRTRQLKEALANSGVSKELLGMNKQAYYYQQQLASYKQAWKDPSLLQERMLTVLRSNTAFQSFWQRNSWLSQLFPAPAGLGTPQAMAGLQSRSDVQAILQHVAASAGGGGDPGKYVQQQAEAARQGLDKFKDQVSRLGGTTGSGDLTMPEFVPNSQHNKTFFQRLEYGFNLQTTAASTTQPIVSEWGISVGYRLNDHTVIGTGISYKLGMGKRIDHMTLTNEGIGLRSSMDVKIKGNWWVTGGFEYNYQQQFSSVNELRKITTWQRSALIGVSRKVSVGKKTANLQLLYDCLAAAYNNQRAAFRARIGYSF